MPLMVCNLQFCMASCLQQIAGRDLMSAAVAALVLLRVSDRS